MKTKFYLCPMCGNIVVKIEDSGVTPHCCGEEMALLTPRTTDSLVEKHVPFFERLDDCHVRVRVGSEPHPMTPGHHICFVWLETVHGGQLRYLSLGQDGTPCNEVTDDPSCGIASMAVADFYTCSDPVVAVYEYCNVHGLFKLDVNE